MLPDSRVSDKTEHVFSTTHWIFQMSLNMQKAKQYHSVLQQTYVFQPAWVEIMVEFKFFF